MTLATTTTTHFPVLVELQCFRRQFSQRIGAKDSQGRPVVAAGNHVQVRGGHVPHHQNSGHVEFRRFNQFQQRKRRPHARRIGIAYKPCVHRTIHVVPGCPQFVAAALTVPLAVPLRVPLAVPSTALKPRHDTGQGRTNIPTLLPTAVATAFPVFAKFKHLFVLPTVTRTVVPPGAGPRPVLLRRLVNAFVHQCRDRQRPQRGQQKFQSIVFQTSGGFKQAAQRLV